ncbi:MAG: VOC family protein [Candidatus Nanopelagicales bacterium]|nr:VOC family protein [Candidatus Nanopelagicales bacterium]MDP4974503.1 VOC family protein [Candidatus Nanopelagicales bacterium]
MPAILDHLVIRAPDLASGEAYVHTHLGIGMLPGGRHSAMGTHNALTGMSLGGEDAYLEVIATDPEAEAPQRSRWFGLDNPPEGPHLVAWVLRVADPHIGSIAPVLDMSRGERSWQITVPADGGLPWDGAGPHLIAWEGAPPALFTSGVHGVSLIVEHPDPEHLRELLHDVDLAAPVSVQPGLFPRLVASFDTPNGASILTSDLTGLSITTERHAAMDLFHLTWRHLDRDDRTPEHDMAMVACAEASLWHWRRVGAPTQWAIGEWQCSRVQSTLGDGVAALDHAQRSLEIAESDRVDDFVPASAHEACARAYAVLGDMDRARRERNIAYGLCLELDNDERDVIEHDLGTIPLD